MNTSTLSKSLVALALAALPLGACSKGEEPASESTETTEEAAPAAEAATEEATEAAAEAATEQAGDAANVENNALYGTWNADMIRAIEEQEMSDQDRQMAMAFIGSIQMAMTFNEDGTLAINTSAMGQERAETGSFNILSQEGNTWQVEVTKPAEEEGAEAEVEVANFTFIDENTLRLEPASGEDGQVLYMNRAGTEEAPAAGEAQAGNALEGAAEGTAAEAAAE